jgi:L-threonylcarbamoyladenylate synthase
MIREATDDAIRAAAALLRAGEVVAFPTETVYGLGADATDATACARIFAIKRRPAFDPLIVHLPARGDLAAVARDWPATAEVLSAHFWPGPLTLVLHKQDIVPDIVTAGLPTVAVRVPDHPVAAALLGAAGCPIAAPSANPFGYVSPTTARHVEAQLGHAVPLILDGGPCRVGLESTILSLADDPPVLLRPGGVPVEAIEQVIGPIRRRAASNAAPAPGTLSSHYALRIPLTIVEHIDDIALGDRADAALLLPAPDDRARGFAHIEVMSSDGSSIAIAARLFAAMRRAEQPGIARVFAVAVPETGLGRAIMDRLRRASHGSGG